MIERLVPSTTGSGKRLLGYVLPLLAERANQQLERPIVMRRKIRCALPEADTRHSR